MPFAAYAIRNSWLVLLVLALLGISACQKGKRPDPVQQAAWSGVVTSHTQGIVSRKSGIQVVFASDVAPEATGDLPQILTIEPAVKGELQFRGPRELLFSPASDLEPGTQYRVSIDPGKLRNVPAELAPFVFFFNVQTPQVDVALDSLKSDPADDRRMILSGKVTTADIEEAGKLERILKATYLDADRAVEWHHAADGLNHSFTIGGLERQAEARQVSVDWDGQAIAASGNGSLKMEIPARGIFVVTGAAAQEENGSRAIRVYFSDSLDSKQNLRGMVRLSQGEFTTSADDNILTLYPQEALTGEVTVTVEQGIRNARGERLKEQVVRTLLFSSEKPQVRFVGKGVILPDGKVQSVPFEAVNARAVHVTAFRIHDDNMGQFLQNNGLDGQNELGRVGRYLWRKVVPLSGPVTGRWTRYDLDVGELLRKHPGGMFQLSLQLLPEDSAYPCGNAKPVDQVPVNDDELKNQEDGDQYMPSAWDAVEEYYDSGEGIDYQQRWHDRADPCKPVYYNSGAGVRAQRNMLASNLGLLAKRDQQGKWLIAVTDLRTGEPKSGAVLKLRNFQNQVIAQAKSDDQGMARVETDATPYLLVAEDGGQRGYLKLSSGSALPISHFDVGGETVSKGLKGFIYGERGVWRPGDDLHLVFVVQDKNKSLPEAHPATLELRDPRGRVVQTLVNNQPVEGFYRFDVKTAADAPTGTWNASVTLGGVKFNKALKIETVMPNRLKIDLDFDKKTLAAGRPLRGTLAAQWLSGASAAGLKADIKLRLTPTPTRFERFTDYRFDDPAREFNSVPEDIFEDTLDDQGKAVFERNLDLDSKAPGMLSATFATRVFERGGAFSINHATTTYAPYKRFVGLRLPKGDVARGMLQTDLDHVIEIGTLGSDGKPVAVSNIKVTLYKLEWRWWWDRGSDSLASYIANQSNAAIRSEEIRTDAEGRGQWKLRINYPEWGRYLVRACDESGGHCTGSTFYIDWPAWAGKQREQSGPAASMLSITADKPKYAVGDTATLQLPESAQGRALMTVESGSRILQARWLEPKAGSNRIALPITADMAPNVYVAVTLVQPHEGKNNDRPIRLYGVVPIEVADPGTVLKPTIGAATEWKPQSKPTVKIGEAGGRAMTYTLAVVDEGLLSLTNFKTPDPFQHFYRREALGVSTWDLFDDVVGAYGAKLERLLSLGGSDSAAGTDKAKSRSRFPPVVRFMGPFRLKAGATASHEVDLPRYVGAVRVMVVAGSHAGAAPAYGIADQSVFVRQPLMILPTMPRVVGPGEEIDVPVSVFVADAAIRNVDLGIQPDAMFTPVGERHTQIGFSRPEEKLGMLRLKAADRLGPSTVRFTATAGGHKADAEINIEVRSANPPTTRLQTHALQPGESWQTTLTPHGLAGTNQATLEVSGIPPLNIEQRLGYLITYPHGCLEQTTSSVFPQLYLPTLVKLEDTRKRRIEDNIRAGIERLRWFQLPNGGFSYWPGAGGGFTGGSLEGYSLWASTYASHFLVEAEKQGYALPASMRSGVTRHLKAAAQSWTESGGSALDQAYRLYVLARAGEPEVGAMNRLREARSLGDTERWMLAAAYHLAGMRDVAASVAPREVMAVRDYRGSDYTFGSTLRDHAIVLQGLTVLGQPGRSQDLVKAISNDLSSDHWHATQSVSWALMAMAQLAGAGNNEPFTFVRSFAGKSTDIDSSNPIHQSELAPLQSGGQAQTLSLFNKSKRVLFATVAVRGIPPAAAEEAEASGLALSVRYSDEADGPVDVSRLRQGSDIVAHVEVANTTSLTIDNIALTHIVPAGWEIRNDRMEGGEATGQREAAPRHNPFDGSREATQARVDYVDIRDDRVLQYFSLRPGERIRFDTRLNAAYRGRYYLPAIQAEAMYDAGKHARSKGMWTVVE